MDRSGIQSVEPKSHPDMHLRQQLRRVDESNDGIGVLLQYLISGKICFLCERSLESAISESVSGILP